MSEAVMRAPSALVEVEPACEEVELAYDWSGWEEWLRGYLDIERQLLIEGLRKALGMVPASVGVGGRGGNDPPGASLYPGGAVRWFDTRPLRSARPGYADHIDDGAERHYTEECQPT
jgi:hypothetical protein